MIKMKMRINFDCDSLINLKTLVIFLSLVFSFNAHAGLEICNESQKYPISVAVAFQKILMVGNGNYEVSGWHEVSPKDCTILLEGDLNGDGYFGYKIWIHAVSKGIVLTNRQFGMDYSDQQFCISNDKFSLTGNGAGVAHTCSKNKYLAPFAIYLDDKDDESLYYLNPDEIIINNPNKSPSSRARLPDLHGALAISSTGRHSTVYLKDTMQEASAQTIDLCKSEEPEATCKIIANFKNQCISVVKGKTKPAIIFYGSQKATKADVVDSAMKKCISQGDSACRERISVCSTYEVKSAIHKENKDKYNAQVIGIAVEFLKEIYAPSPKLKTGPDPWDQGKTGANNRPSNYDDSPPECGKIYDRSMECAHKYDVRGNAFAKETLVRGGACYPFAHLAEICGGTDTEQFDNYSKYIEKIDKGELAYEKFGGGLSSRFTYYNVPKNMKFPIANSEPLQYEDEGFYIHLVREDVGLLIHANVINPYSRGLGSDFKDSKILECDYNAKQLGLMDQYHFWYKKPPTNLPSLKIENFPNHPLLRNGIANNQCPASIEDLHKLTSRLK